ncbi:hypothetical protein [Kitasatospora sp. NPDC050543]|uniref:hypothetical protein n=1 Tax=Kitasatospora sp. NPDC050543 TaxID=3364054 RepID=UPI00379D55B1
MSPIPLTCPRCGRPQRAVPGGPERAVRVVHTDTGREECEPGVAGSGAAEPGTGEGRGGADRAG